MKKSAVCYFGILFLTTFLTFPTYASGDFNLKDFELELGVGHITYSGDSDPEFTYRLNLGYNDLPVYGFVGYENPGVDMLGQSLAKVGVWSMGLGAKKKWNDLAVFIELGYGYVDLDTKLEVQKEIVYTQLVSNHHSEHRPIPVDPHNYESSYNLDDALVGRLGLEYMLTKDFNVKVSYKWMTAREQYAIWDAEARAAGGGYWTEHSTYDFAGMEIGIFYRF